jgi:hypothetical protein
MMNLGINPNISEIFTNRPAEKTSTGTNNYNGASFVESLKELTAGQLPQVAADSNAASLNLKRQKEDFDKLFSFTQAEEEIAQEYITHINKLLNQLKK